MSTLKVKKLSGWKATIGLLNSKKAYPVFLQTRFGIHTWGLKFGIDVLILDKDNQIVRICKNLRPNRIFLWNPKFDFVIELPSGEIQKLKLRLGDKINIEVVK